MTSTPFDETFQLTLADLPGPAVIYDSATGIVEAANAAAARLYGYAEAELVGHPLARLLPDPGDIDSHQATSRSEVDDPARWCGLEHRRRDGTLVKVAIRSRPLGPSGSTRRALFIDPVQAPAMDTATSRALHQRPSLPWPLLLEAMSEAVLFTDVDGVILDWNPAAEAVFGYARAEVVGRTAAFLHPPGEGAAVVEAILRSLEEEGVWEGMLRTVHRDGTLRVCQVRVLPVRDRSGRMVGTLGINRDVTTQVQVQRALKETEDGLRVLADQLPHMLWMAGPDGESRYFNRGWAGYTGQTTSSGVAAGWVSALHPDDLAETTRRWKQSVATGRDFSIEHRLRDRGGHYRWHLTQAKALRDAEGRIVRWYGTSIEIHAQKTLETVLRQREAYFRNVFEHVHDAIVLFDPDTGAVIDANPQAEQLYGYDRETLLRLTLDDLDGDDEEGGLWLRELRATGSGSHQVLQKTRDGTRLSVEINAAMMEYRDREVILTVNRDVTERRELERRLQQSQKMEAIGRLAGGVAHDFNNLTTAIRGFASILADDIGGYEGEAADALAEIDRAAERATSLTRQLLAYTRQTVMRGQVLDVNRVVTSAGELLRRLIGEDIDLRAELADDLRPVRADPVQLHQVLMNLAVNSRDAMPAGGALTVTTANVHVDAALAAQRPPLAPGDYVLLRVQDTGQGMAQDTLDHVFEPFFTTKPVGEGTGLGLATVYGIVKQTGGFIWAESEPGAGTTFDIYLPPVDADESRARYASARSAGAPAGIAAGPGAPPAARPGRLATAAGATNGATAPEGSDRSTGAGPAATVLLVEDEDGVRKLSRRILERAGFAVLEARDGAQALELAGAEESPIDLVLTDMVMPRMSGKQLAEEFGRVRPGSRILFMSGYTGESLEERGDLTKTDVVLEKPFSPTELVDAVRGMLAIGGT